MKILIDNGLGRDTTGKRSPDGRLLEWSYTREIARRVVAELQAQHYYASLLVPEWFRKRKTSRSTNAAGG